MLRLRITSNMFTIYENPIDIPGKFVVRRLMPLSNGNILFKSQPSFTGRSLPDCRAWLRLFVPGEVIRICRAVNDDPVIVESWMQLTDVSFTKN